ncbi:hypothetical protein [Streptomyces antimycoticus]|uniref:hypothetical protein n=1 Tax=Streptomyces antimycoticus TaxID=68175 RepID=UPI0036E299D3
MATTTSPLKELASQVEHHESEAARLKAELFKAAVAETVKSWKYGHLSAVARDAGIVSQYLRDLVEEAHPGWLAWAAEQRANEKAEKAAKKTAPTTKTAGSKKAAA